MRMPPRWGFPLWEGQSPHSGRATRKPCLFRCSKPGSPAGRHALTYWKWQTSSQRRVRACQRMSDGWGPVTMPFRMPAASSQPNPCSDRKLRRVRWPASGMVALSLLLAACSSGPQPSNPSRTAASVPIKGYGVPGVEGADLASMLSTCATVEDGPFQGTPSAKRDLQARCAQLQRTMGTQPGNSVRAGR